VAADVTGAGEILRAQDAPRTEVTGSAVTHDDLHRACEVDDELAPRGTESWVEGSGENLTRNGRVQVMELEGYTVGMAHELILMSLGDDVLPGTIERSFPKDESLAAVLAQIFGKPVDIVVFGYTHEAMVEDHDGVLLVNPGSPSLVRQQVRLGTVAILEVTQEDRGARIIDLAELGHAGASRAAS